jgi:hypothetical protein
MFTYNQAKGFSLPGIIKLVYECMQWELNVYEENELHIYDAYSQRADGKQSGNSIFVRHWNL